MSESLFSPFAEVVEFDDAKLRNALSFTTDQVLFIRNKLVHAISSKLSLAGDTAELASPEAFVRSQEYFRGRMEVLQELLDEIEDMRTIIETEIEQNAVTIPQ